MERALGEQTLEIYKRIALPTSSVWQQFVARLRGKLNYQQPNKIDVVTVHDLYATMLHQLGIDSDSFTVKFQGQDPKLTGVEGGHVIRRLLA